MFLDSIFRRVCYPVSMIVSAIDLNCDLGEGCPMDGELMPLITSANVACGFHAGDPAVAHETLRLAAENGVKVGAHPGFPDRENFGRRELERTAAQVFQDCVYQIGALAALGQSLGMSLSYLKAHGALYNMACRDEAYAQPVVRAAEQFGLPVLGLPRSRLQALCQGRCRFVAEGYADRRYAPDGSLVPRSRPDAFVETVDEALRQVQWLIREQGIETICVHGDNPRAVEFVRQLRTALTGQNLPIRPFA